MPETDLHDFTRLTAKAAVAWEVTGAAAGEALAKLRTALSMTNEETAKYADAINHLSDNTASSAPDLVDYARRVAAAGEFFGFSKEQTLAFGAAMVGAGAEANVAATSFRNMGRALTRGGSAAKAQRRGFQALGLDVKKVAKAMQRDAAGTTLKVMERIGKLPEHLQASVMSDVFGDEARALAPLLGRLDILRDALKLVADEQGYVGSVAKEFAKRSATAEFALIKFKSQVREVALSLGGALLPAMRRILAAAGPVVLRIAEFAEKNAVLVSSIGAAVGGLVALRIAGLALSFLGLMGKGWLLSAALGFVKFGGGAAKAAAGAVALQRALGAMSGQRLSFFQTLTTGIAGLVRAVPGLGFVTSAFGAAAAIISGPVLTAVAAFGTGGFLLWKNWDRVSTFVSAAAAAIGEKLAPSLGFARPVLEAIQPVLKGVGDAFAWVGKAASAASGWLGEVFTQKTLTDADRAAVAKSAHDMVNGIADAVADAGSAMVGAGLKLMASLLDGIKQGATAIFGFVSNLGSRIASSITGAASRAWGAVSGGAPAGPSTPARSRGGRVSRGQSYVVGERRPEVFTPGQSGYVSSRVPEGGGGSPITMQVTLNVTSTVPNIPALARELSDEISRETRALLRGIQGEAGFGYGY